MPGSKTLKVDVDVSLDPEFLQRVSDVVGRMASAFVDFKYGVEQSENAMKDLAFLLQELRNE